MLPAVSVTAKHPPPNQTGYRSWDAESATKTATPLFETPASITVVPAEAIQDQQSNRLKDVLENVSGVRSNGRSDRVDEFIARGFRTGDLYRNGLQLNFTAVDTVIADKVEVLKGPAAVLYGRVEPGGLINLSTRLPLANPYFSLEQQLGSFDYFRTELDATGPLDDGAKTYARFVGAYQRNQSFRDFHDLERIVAYPSLSWRPAPGTIVTVDLEYLRDDGHIDYFGLPALGSRPARVPIKRSFQDPGDPAETFNYTRLGLNLNHRINPDWIFRTRFLAAFQDHRELDLNPVAIRTDQRTMDRAILFFGLDDRSYQTNIDVVGTEELGPTHHTFLVGLDYRQAIRSLEFRFRDFAKPDPALAIDIFNPRYGISPASFDRAKLPLSFQSHRKREQFGIYFQDHITFLEKFHVLGGGRYDWSRAVSGDQDVSIEPAPLSRGSDQAFSPRFGLLYQPWRTIAVYGSWAQSFGQNNGISATGRPLPPETGEQFEVGLKTEWFDQQLSATLAGFNLSKANLLTDDLSTPQPFDERAIGEAISQGLEFELAGKLSDEFSVIGSYAYTDAKITKDDSGLAGKRLLNTPRHAGSLWIKWEANGPDASGPSVGFGAFAAGPRWGDDENTFVLPGYVRLDALAAYHWRVAGGQVVAQFNVDNLLNKTYYESADADTNAEPRLSIYPAKPLTVLGSIRLEF